MKHNTTNGKRTFPSTLFVCAGNTCRSPMAEHLLKMLCQERYIEVNTISRGLYCAPITVTEEAYVTIQELDPKTTIRQHVARQVYYEDLMEAELVLTMKGVHRDILILSMEKQYKEDISRKTFTLKEYAGYREDYDIEDPLRLPLLKHSHLINNVKVSAAELNRIRTSHFRRCRDEIKGCLEHILDNPTPDINELSKRQIKQIKAERIRKRPKGFFSKLLKGDFSSGGENGFN